MIQKEKTDDIDEAYKHLTGDPGMTAVSDAAMGKKPLTDDEQRMKEADEQDESPAHEAAPGDAAEDKAEGEDSDYCDPKCMDINEAYALLFEGLAAVAKAK